MNYRLVSLLVWPVFFLYTLRVALRDKSLRYFKQRLGFNYPAQSKRTIWVHCASVGEVNTYWPLHKKLQEKYSDANFVITTNTVTGAQTVTQKSAPRTQHCFLPIESASAIKNFLQAWQPSNCLIMETELWPLLYRLTHHEQIPIYIIHGRLSHRSLNAGNWIKEQYRNSFKYVQKILCKSSQEQKNFASLGARAEQLVVTGNLKFSAVENINDIAAIDLGRPYIVAASTHNDEERMLAELWQKKNRSELLVIVPRHPNRSEHIQKQLRTANIHFAVRSNHDVIDASTGVYLADTLGELRQLMVGAEFVFIGGSLVKHGGQNLLEAAALSKAIICGPHMYNFAEETELLLSHQACYQAENIDELSTMIDKLLNDPEYCKQLGQRAGQSINHHATVLGDYLAELPL